MSIEHDSHTVTQTENFIQLRREENHCRSLITHSYNLLVIELNRANIQTACRLRGNQELYRAAKFTGDNHFLLIPARQTANIIVNMRWTNIILPDKPFRVQSNRVIIHYNAV